MKGFFITGTDTEIGKTMITGLLTRYFLSKGVKAFPYKPIQSGAIQVNGKWVAPDVEFYEEIANQSFNNETNTYLLNTPSSPHFAAMKEQIQIEPHSIVQQVEKLTNQNNLVFVEGAGGLIVPINDETTMLDLIEKVSLPVILVARAGLGTINHTSLSVMALIQRNIPIAGIILNQNAPDGNEEIEEDNYRMIEQLTGVPVIGKLQYIDFYKERLSELDENQLMHNWKMEILEEVINHGISKAR
ncbi:dethiobiotin synthetase [Bacillus pakistanensis]|uniref:ATP-dependent dethiobiotin synthetase BioD n=1 Tax=Rossellomorea pakistanensis TaxID=992288 RepID=A0ABS2NJ54_9BACI|nr:dethiobiotin synthetase [Bacillus pakistanensis]